MFLILLLTFEKRLEKADIYLITFFDTSAFQFIVYISSPHLKLLLTCFLQEWAS